ncbi:cyclin-A2-3-like isoform X2 [Punica granatum]|uniref:Cyclin-A2-3-like isoform X2 n=1 Tax=Punica granatum TaxID=22663 RepID=A0A218X0B7_PUNGR|nr:cyclin-A2-3-like isoform X2 [Punica granatum]OWM78216.1 hypothetical protein CDL15_Pgr015035 [Punica granatum]
MNQQLVDMKESSWASIPEAVTGRVTRARAAALRMTSAAASQAPNVSTLGKKNQSEADPEGLLRKRKAVLQDVTNIHCETSYNDCLNAANFLAKSGKQGREALIKVTKVMKSASVEILKPQGVQNQKAKQSAKASRKEACSRKMPVTMKSDENVSSQLSESEDSLLDGVSSAILSQEDQGPSQKEKGLLSEDIPSNPEIINIDADKKNPLLCSIYAPDIYDNLRLAELLRRPKCGYMEMFQRDITKGMRGILVDWLVEVSQEYSLAADTLYITVHLIDWSLSQNFIERHRLQLLGITCMLIASKYEEICAPRVDELCFMTDNTYTREEVLRMEGQLLNYFDFRISGPTTKTFLRRFLLAAQANYTSPSLDLEYLADYLAELTLIEYEFLNFLPSIIAASAVFLAKWTLDNSCHPWNPTLEYYTRYKVSDLKTTVFALQDLQLSMNRCPLNAIQTKYRQQKFKSVAGLSSTSVLETLF